MDPKSLVTVQTKKVVIGPRRRLSELVEDKESEDKVFAKKAYRNEAYKTSYDYKNWR